MIFGHSVALYCVPIHTEGRKPANSCSLSRIPDDGSGTSMACPYTTGVPCIC